MFFVLCPHPSYGFFLWQSLIQLLYLGLRKFKFFFNKDKYILASYTAINTYHVHIFYNVYPSLSGPTENYETTQFGAINRSWDIYFGEVIIQLILMCGGGGVVIHLQMNNFAIKKHKE